MKFLIFPFFLLFSLNLRSQLEDAVYSDSLELEIQLENITSIRKPILIKKKSYLEFVKFTPTYSEKDSSVFCEERIQGSLCSFTRDSISIVANAYSKSVFNDYDYVYVEKKSIVGDNYLYKLNLSDIDGVYFSTPNQIRLRNASMTVMGMSLFAALIVAPLISLEYTAINSNSQGGFNRKQYFSIAGTCMAFAAVSFSSFVILKPRYYSFANDDYRPKRQHWRLGLVN